MPDIQNSVLRILIADDHALFRGGLALLVQSVEENVEVLEANGLEDVVSILSNDNEIDLLLLDLTMPGMEGIQSVQEICNKWPEIPIIVVSVTEDLDVIRQVLSLGVMGYIPKTSTPDITNSAIKLVLSGGIYMPPHMLRSNPNDDAAIVSTSQQAEKPLHTGLTQRQLEVLELVAVGMSNKAIGKELGLAENTVKMHTSRLYKTLGVENRTEAVARLSKLKAEHKNSA